MAQNIVYSNKMQKVVLLKCLKCGCLYEPDGKTKSRFFETCLDYEQCPQCGYEHNGTNQIIPLWKYNLIKYARKKIKRLYDRADEEQEV